MEEEYNRLIWYRNDAFDSGCTFFVVCRFTLITDHHPMKNKLILGVLLTLLSTLLYSSLTAIIKAQHDAMPPMPVVIFMQSAVPLFISLLFLMKKGLPYTRNLLRSSQVPLQFVRSAVSLSLTFFLFYSMKYIPLVNTLLLANTSPLLVPFISYFLLSQKINHRIWVPLMVGFLGVAFVLRPESQVMNVGSILALAAAMCMGTAVVLVRKLSRRDSSETTTFYFFLFSTLISGVVALFYWQPISLAMWGILLLIGVMYLALQYATTIALKYINAHLLSILFYFNIIFGTMISWAVWHTLPSMMTWIGIVFIMVGGIFCILIEHQEEKTQLHYAAA